MTIFTTKEANLVTLVDYSTEGYVAIAINGEEVAYFDKDGLNLLGDCDRKSGIVNGDGYLKIVKHG